MRELLFRGKTDKGEWVEGNYYYDPDLEVTEITGFNYETSEEGLQRESFCKSVIPETIGQFTGLSDKNNKDIFEGDIVKLYSDFTYLIRWNSQSAKFEAFNPKHNAYLNGWTNCASKMTVIGNTYDNPELLKEGKENA